jgi:hypothetical protein
MTWQPYKRLTMYWSIMVLTFPLLDSRTVHQRPARTPPVHDQTDYHTGLDNDADVSHTGSNDMRESNVEFFQLV